MGYQLILPPRFVQPLSLSQVGAFDCQKDENTAASRRKVHFHDSANRTVLVSVFHGENLWYNVCDYIKFEMDWERNMMGEAREMITTIQETKKRRFVVGQRPVPFPMEELRSFQRKNCESRRRLIKSLLEHQQSCREQGFSDPDGYRILSRALSRSDRKAAWEVAAANAYEVEILNRTTISVSLSSLLMDYYCTSVHPHMSDPLSYLAKVLLCQCD